MKNFEEFLKENADSNWGTINVKPFKKFKKSKKKGIVKKKKVEEEELNMNPPPVVVRNRDDIRAPEIVSSSSFTGEK